MMWQPIESAPLGERVLICFPDGQIELMRLDDGMWVDDNDFVRSLDDPTHWMKLPDLPEQK